MIRSMFESGVGEETWIGVLVIVAMFALLAARDHDCIAELIARSINGTVKGTDP